MIFACHRGIIIINATVRYVLRLPASIIDFPCWNGGSPVGKRRSHALVTMPLRSSHGISESHSPPAIQSSLFGKSFPSEEWYYLRSTQFENVLDSNLCSTMDTITSESRPEIVSAQLTTELVPKVLCSTKLGVWSFRSIELPSWSLVLRWAPAG